ncbi:MAG: EamA family transporter [Candidatus Thiodiazotropha sp. (ex Ustalcina ferruginea)]|nr:EamA family transporter [Candidatus Thiodiazotropha sp. (ex Ustalcina ferruginea)]
MLYKQNLLLGALFILLSELMFASMGATVKFVTQALPSEMAVFMRNLFGLALFMPLVWSHGWVSLRTEIFPFHLLRSVAGVSAMYCFFYALANLPLAARISPVTYSSVLFGAGYGYLFWDERLSVQFILGALLIAIAGILAIGSRGRIDDTLVSDPTRP